MSARWEAVAGIGSIVLLGCTVCHCGGLYDPVHHIASARVYGNIDFYAYYYVDLLIGTPPQRVSVIVDTGSGVTAFPCKSCRHCGRHIDPAFDFEGSSTAKWVRCGKECKGSCSREHCGYHQGYTEGSSISGWWFRDMVRLGDSIQRNPPVSMSLGCHQDENRLFYTQKANGIMGIRPPGRGAPTVLQELFADRAHIDVDVFALCLAEWGGSIIVGGHNASYHTGALTYVPLTTTSGYYSIPLTSMSVQGHVISSRFGRTIIDSGTTYVYMASQPYRALRGAIESYCQSHGGCGARSYGTCWELPRGSADLSNFPVVEFNFNGAKTAWVPRAYLYRKASASRWCYAFEDDGARATTTVLGAAWMLQQEVIFDLRASKVGIAQANCPEFRERPVHNPHADLSIPTTAPAGTPPLSVRLAVARPPKDAELDSLEAARLNASNATIPGPSGEGLPPSGPFEPPGALGKSSQHELHSLLARAGVVVSLVAVMGWAARKHWARKPSTAEGVAARASTSPTGIGAAMDSKEECNNVSDEEDPLVATPRDKS